MPHPGDPAPDLALETVAHGPFRLAEPRAAAATLLVFYRGRHCPLCRAQLGALDAAAGRFADLGVEVVAVSADPPDRAARMAEEAGLATLRVAHSLPLDAARAEWGLFVSEGLAEWGEPAFFSEPGHFLVTAADGCIAYASVQSMPYGRPHPEDLLHGIDFVQTHGYPVRGTVRRPPTGARPHPA